MSVLTKKFRRGFTLIEAIVAALILCLSVMLLATGSSRQLSEMKLNRQYEVAAALADKQLTMIDFFGIDTFVAAGQTEGEFEDFEAYTWQATAEAQEVDNLYLVSLSVNWTERNKPYSFSVQTMLDGTGMYVEAEAEGEEEQEE